MQPRGCPVSVRAVLDALFLGFDACVQPAVLCSFTRFATLVQLETKTNLSDYEVNGHGHNGVMDDARLTKYDHKPTSRAAL